ncbi:hypothetical protein HMP06_0488 [Sphingomonas sp. HMP6]|nr:hypothetical protein HMP06_0488 [Sphingomonas sp. HMP6]
MENVLDPTWLASTMTAADIRTSHLVKASGISKAQIERIRAGSPTRTDTLRKLIAGIDALKAKPLEASE